MLPEEALESLESLDREAEERRSEGDLPGEADARSRKAAMLGVLGEFSDALIVLDQAISLIREARDVGKEAEYQYNRGLLLSRLPERRGEMDEAWRLSVALARSAGDRGRELAAMQRVIKSRIDAQDRVGAIFEVDTLVADLEKLDPSKDLLDVLKLRATLYQARGHAEKSRPFLRQADADLTRAISLARDLGEIPMRIEMRLQRRAVREFLGWKEENEPFSTILADAKELGDFDLLATVHLEMGNALLRQNKVAEALPHAEDARQFALQASSPMVYMLACMAISEIRNILGDRPGVIAILLTCKATLEDTLGKEVGEQIDLVLNSLETRWGKQGLMEALEAYRVRMRAATPEA